MKISKQKISNNTSEIVMTKAENFAIKLGLPPTNQRDQDENG